MSEDLYARVESGNREGKTLERLVGDYSLTDFADDTIDPAFSVAEATNGSVGATPPGQGSREWSSARSISARSSTATARTEAEELDAEGVHTRIPTVVLWDAYTGIGNVASDVVGDQFRGLYERLQRSRLTVDLTRQSPGRRGR